MENCLLCNLNAMITRQDNSSRTIYSCLSCGVYVVSDLAIRAIRQHACEVSAFLQSRRLAGQSDTVLISYENAKREKDYLQLTVSQIVEMSPENFTDQMHMSLANLANLSAYPGEEIKVESLDSAPMFYIKNANFDALSFVIKSMVKAELIDVNYYGASFFPCGITVSPKGWDLAAELCSKKDEDLVPRILLIYNSASGKDAVSIVRDAAQKAAKDCGMKLVSSDMIMGGGGLVGNEIAANIKSSTYILIDLTDVSPEIFYAWGYAKAVGKPILLTCSEEKRNKTSKAIGSHIGISFWHDANQLPTEFYNFLKACE